MYVPYFSFEMTFLRPSNSKGLPPAQHYIVFMHLNYIIIKRHYSMKILKNRLVNTTN